MVEISKSGSGEGPGRATGRGYSTAHHTKACRRRWPTGTVEGVA
jgi:hypothetical protein